MGMYTELIFGASLKKDTPDEVIETLQILCGIKDVPENFDYPKRNPFYAQSYYFGVSSSIPFMYFDDTCKTWIVSTRGNVKNYDNDIEYFLEWIKPHIESGSGIRDMYAIVTYEEASEPTIYYLYDKK